MAGANLSSGQPGLRAEQATSTACRCWRDERGAAKRRGHDFDSLLCGQTQLENLQRTGLSYTPDARKHAAVLADVQQQIGGAALKRNGRIRAK
ncbi:MAG: hypothetical protein ACLSWS_03635 [Faecalispora jeddahensis]